MRGILKAVGCVFLLAILFMFRVQGSNSDVDLSSFPDFLFNKDGELEDLAFIIGSSAKAEEVIGMIDIALMIYAEQLERTGSIKPIPSYFDTSWQRAKNLIIIGNPCNNAAAAAVSGYPKDCMDGLYPGEGKIKLIEHGSGNLAILIEGATALDTRRATLALLYHKELGLKGKEAIISGAAVKEIVLE